MFYNILNSHPDSNRVLRFQGPEGLTTTPWEYFAPDLSGTILEINNLIPMLFFSPFFNLYVFRSVRVLMDRF